MTSLQTLAVAVELLPNLLTAPVPHDADDPAVWIHPTRPEQSLILGTDKEATNGGLFVFDLDGKIVQSITPIDRPNNVDVRGNLVVVSERMARQLRIFKVDPATRRLSDVTGSTKVFQGIEGEEGAPMGIALYQRPSDQAVFAIVSPKTGPTTNYLAQYRLTENPVTGRVDATLVRRFGNFSGTKEIEALAVDDQLGYLYASDETVGTRKLRADPDAPEAGQELAFFNRTEMKGDHEGIGLWTRPDGTGYLVCTDQQPDSSVYRVFRREGANEFLGSFRMGADETDGIEVTSTPLGAAFPHGLMVAMNSKGKNFVVIDWQRVAKALFPNEKP